MKKSKPRHKSPRIMWVLPAIILVVVSIMGLGILFADILTVSDHTVFNP